MGLINAHSPQSHIIRRLADYSDLVTPGFVTFIFPLLTLGFFLLRKCAGGSDKSHAEGVFD